MWRAADKRSANVDGQDASDKRDTKLRIHNSPLSTMENWMYAHLKHTQHIHWRHHKRARHVGGQLPLRGVLNRLRSVNAILWCVTESTRVTAERCTKYSRSWENEMCVFRVRLSFAFLLEITRKQNKRSVFFLFWDQMWSFWRLNVGLP